MDGVITNTMPDHYRAWHQIFHEMGISVTHEDIYSREGQSGRYSLLEITKKYGQPYDAKSAPVILKKKEDLFKTIVKIRFIQGTRNFIKALNRKGIVLALVTGTSRHEMQKILPENLLNLFQVVVTGDEVKHGKPHPEPYRKALKQLNIQVKEAVVIENAPFGIRSAKAAGIPCIALETSLPRQYLEEADYIYKTVRDFREDTEFIKL